MFGLLATLASQGGLDMECIAGKWCPRRVEKEMCERTDRSENCWSKSFSQEPEELAEYRARDKGGENGAKKVEYMHDI
jgi:hypothetical protein